MHGRIHGFAVVDILLTVLGGAYLATKHNKNIGASIFLLFVLGELIHVLLGVKTPFTNLE